MNYLAHVFLAPDTAEARIGSLLGDFRRGIKPGRLPSEVCKGLRHHLSVDEYTDQHPQVVESRRLFSSQRRRFAGVALDILYDHYLLRHWDRFSDCDRDAFIEQVYGELAHHEHLMPSSMVPTARRITRDDWFGHYRELDNIGHALDRVAQRIRFPNRFTGMIEEIRPRDAELEDRFLEFFTDLHRTANHF